ncbi:uncharacterized protein LOC143301015 [Babylonia areolata]|uniref:uncharacterized protein LOC143301015 n=1 Tax=Babylonia areolata TaxID=304850 RepID=UPI003FD41651
MDYPLRTVTLLFLLFHCISFCLSQPTVQNSFWRSPEASLCNNNNGHQPHHGQYRLSGSPGGFNGLQQSVDMVLLEMQRQAVDTDSLREEVRDLQTRHEDSRRLLLQLTESVNILVKKLVKTPACECDSGGGGGGGGGGGDGDDDERGTGGRRGGGGGGGGGGGDVVSGGGDSKGFQQEDNNVNNNHVKVFNASSRPSSDAGQGVLMDEKGASVLSPHPGSDTHPHPHRTGQTPQDLGVNQTRAEVRGRQDGALSVAPGTVTSAHTATSGPTTTTTTTPDPILMMYNGSVPKDCDDIKDLGYATNGTYVIKPSSASRSVVVLCEFHVTDVWTLVQRRQDGSQDFYRGWSDYKRGFGDLRSEFWLGNEVLHQLTTQDFYRLKIDMWEWPRAVSESKRPQSRYYFAESRYFYVDSEAERYKLHVPNDYFAYTGFGGSGLRVHTGPFLTKDVEDLPAGMRKNCAQTFHCGWWFTTCVRNANFNGRYYKGGYANVTAKRRARDDIYWPNIDQSLYRVVMKVGRVNESYAFGTQ